MAEAPDNDQSTAETTNTNNIPTYAELAVVLEKPKKLDMVHLRNRVQSFASRRQKHSVPTEDLASAGFYYGAQEDSTFCFACGGSLKNWKKCRDPIVQHARDFPQCFFVLQKMGQDFIDAVHELSKTNKEVSLEMVKRNIDSQDGKKFFSESKPVHEKDPAIKAVIDLGFDPPMVTQLALSLKEQNSPIASSDDLIEELFKPTSVQYVLNIPVPTNIVNDHCEDQIFELKSKIIEMRQSATCKICLEEPLAVVFLPCAHFATCLECSYALKKCPVCRKEIYGTTRAYLR